MIRQIRQNHADCRGDFDQEGAMNVTEAIARRISVRAFRPDTVPGAVVREILEKASRAPSGGNVQPWKVYALAGQSLTEFKSLVAERAAAGTLETA
jgi:nitroreductase